MEKQNSYILNLEGNKLHSSVKVMEIKDRKKYKGSFDYSLEAIKVYNISKEIYSDTKDKGENIFYMIKGKQYTDAIINVNFKYSVKTDVMVKVKDAKGNMIDAIELNKKGEPLKRTVRNIKQLRTDLYKDGFDIIINGKKQHYVKFLRSCGSSKQGKCLFIRDDLYSSIMEWSMMGLVFKEGTRADLPALEAYLALTCSNIIDTIEIDYKSILVVKDCTSTFKNDVMLTTLKDGKLSTGIEKQYEITNKLFDGESLLDCVVFGKSDNDNVQWVNGKYSEKSMLLLRNRFLKTNCISTNIQMWFKDNNITKISQLNGFTYAKNISQIKMITTESSLKFLKFKNKFKSREACLKYYLRNLEPTWGIVKYDKGTKWMDSTMVRSSYQLLNTIHMPKEDLQAFMQPTMDYINLIQSDNVAFKNHLHLKIKKDIELGESTSSDEFIFNMMLLGDKFLETEIFIKFKEDIIENYKNSIKKGKVLLDGNYETLISCPIEMLQESIGIFKGVSVLGVDNVMTKRFNYDQELLMARSPHVCQGNLFIANNVFNETIDKYINLTENMIVINTIQENCFNRLSSADVDSDSCLVTDNTYLLKNGKKYYNDFLVPCTSMESDSAEYNYCKEDMAIMDTKNSDSQQLIGEIVNLSMFLVSILWDKLNQGKTINELQEIYSAISELDILSTCAIDSSKKTFKGLDIKKELRKAREKWLDKEVIDVNKNIAPKDVQEKFVLMEDLQSEVRYLEYEIEEAKKDLEEDEEVDEELRIELKELRKELRESKKEVKGYTRKPVRPLFFKYINKDKTINYTYKKYNCTMDNIVELLPTQIIKRDSVPYKLQLLQCFNGFKIEGKTQYPKKDKFIEDVKEMENECAKVMAENKNTMEIKEIFKLQHDIRLEVINNWKDKLDAKTIQNIISEVGHQDTHNKYERKLINTLYRSNKDTFLSLFKIDVDKEMYMLKKLNREPVEDDNIIKIYGVNYVRVPVVRDDADAKIIDISKFFISKEEKVIKSNNEETQPLNGAIG